jgi:hypothetical protein
MNMFMYVCMYVYIAYLLKQDCLSMFCLFFQIICDVAFSNMSDAILIGCKNNRDSIIECVRESNCSIIVLK